MIYFGSGELVMENVVPCVEQVTAVHLIIDCPYSQVLWHLLAQ
jgi:hypothetical protein